MADPLKWVEALAGLKALYDVVQFGADYASAYAKHRRERETITESQRVSAQFSTYSDREVEDIIRRIEECRDRFIRQGSGKDRARCLCSILNEVREGNGGRLPRIDNWQGMYEDLRCDHV